MGAFSEGTKSNTNIDTTINANDDAKTSMLKSIVNNLVPQKANATETLTILRGNAILNGQKISCQISLKPEDHMNRAKLFENVKESKVYEKVAEKFNEGSKINNPTHAINLITDNTSAHISPFELRNALAKDLLEGNVDGKYIDTFEKIMTTLKVNDETDFGYGGFKVDEKSGESLYKENPLSKGTESIGLDTDKNQFKEICTNNLKNVLENENISKINYTVISELFREIPQSKSFSSLLGNFVYEGNSFYSQKLEEAREKGIISEATYYREAKEMDNSFDLYKARAIDKYESVQKELIEKEIKAETIAELKTYIDIMRLIGMIVPSPILRLGDALAQMEMKELMSDKKK